MLELPVRCGGKDNINKSYTCGSAEGARNAVLVRDGIVPSMNR